MTLAALATPAPAAEETAARETAAPERALAASDRANVADGLAALVNGTPITIGDVLREQPRWLRDEVAAAPRDADPAALWATAYAKALRALEDKELVLQKYRSGDMRVPPHAVDRAVSSILENRFDGNRQALLADLSRRKLGWEEWRSSLEEEIIVSSMKNAFADGSATVSPSEVARAYETLKAERYSTPERVRVFLAALPGEAEAEAFAARLRDGADFATLARAHSTDSRAAAGGDCGLVTPRDEFAPALAAAVEALAEGGVSQPVELGGKHYIVRRGETVAAGSRPLQEVWEELRKELLEKRRAELFDAWTGHLRDAADIREFTPFGDPSGNGNAPQ